MWKKTHQGLTQEVIRELESQKYVHFNAEESSSLMKGVITPDIWGNYPHHHGKNDEIGRHLNLARRLFLEKNYIDSFYNLGIALHYIQDHFTTFPSTIGDYAPWVKETHNNWEQGIHTCLQKSAFVSNIDRIIWDNVEDLEWRNYYSSLAQELSSEVQGRCRTLEIATLNGQMKTIESKASPLVDFNLGYKASYVVCNSIVSLERYQPLNDKLTRLHSEQEDRLRAKEKEISDRILGLMDQRAELVRRRVPPDGVVSKIKNWFTDRKIRAIDGGAILSKEAYFRKDHFREVMNYYDWAFSQMTDEHVDWYLFEKPILDPETIPRELLDISEASRIHGLDQSSLRDSLVQKKVPVHLVGNSDITRSRDLDGLIREMNQRFDSNGRLRPIVSVGGMARAQDRQDRL